MENKDFKWCIKVTEENVDVLNQYLKDNKDKYSNYCNDWVVETLGNYFHNQDCGSEFKGHNNTFIYKGLTEITFEQFKKYVLKQDSTNMIDYKIKGTKLPTIPAGTNFRGTHWENSASDDPFDLEYNDFVSFGSKVHNNEIYILAEEKDYVGKFFYMIKESDILKLTNTKNIQKEIIGYKAPMDLFDGNVKKGNIFTKNGTINYKCNNLLLPKEIVEQWEPVYKSEEKIINIGFDVKVTSEGIFHKSDNITEFVMYMNDYYNREFLVLNKEQQFGMYGAIPKDVIFSKTGCQNVETKLSDWKKVWEAYKEISK